MNDRLFLNFGDRQLTVAVISKNSIRSRYSTSTLKTLRVFHTAVEPLEVFFAMDAIHSGRAMVIEAEDAHGHDAGRWKLARVRVIFPEKSIPQDRHGFTLDLLEYEPMNPSPLWLGSLELQPYRYFENEFKRRLVVRARALIRENDYKALLRSLTERRNTLVRREGISPELVRMELSAAVVSKHADGCRLEIQLTQMLEVDDEEEVDGTENSHARGPVDIVSFQDTEDLGRCLVKAVARIESTGGVVTADRCRRIWRDQLVKLMEYRCGVDLVEDIDDADFNMTARTEAF